MQSKPRDALQNRRQEGWTRIARARVQTTAGSFAAVPRTRRLPLHLQRQPQQKTACKPPSRGDPAVMRQQQTLRPNEGEDFSRRGLRQGTWHAWRDPRFQRSVALQTLMKIANQLPFWADSRKESTGRSKQLPATDEGV